MLSQFHSERALNKPGLANPRSKPWRRPAHNPLCYEEASNIEVNPQTRQKLQEFYQFLPDLICLLLICIIVMLL
ncbi:hypothetical protein GDO86_009664 [Hymenochirus boettgeri]|uniref:Phospholamban n=1 Tax=Hymenochirus boettgeri TaxID=247094 RepID=A0A8T2JJV1_9PIPI|nr:hypothetical protein GDO86_009664 [Hymenochirus boettgeri]